MNASTVIALIVILAAAGLATASIIRARRCRKKGSGASASAASGASASAASGASASAASGASAGPANSASADCRGCALSPFCRKKA